MVPNVIGSESANAAATRASDWSFCLNKTEIIYYGTGAGFALVLILVVNTVIVVKFVACCTSAKNEKNKDMNDQDNGCGNGI